MKVLMFDIGGSNVKAKVSADSEVRKIPTGPEFTPERMAREVRRIVEGWEFDRVSIGYPGLLRHARPSRDPLNLGPGWLDFDYEHAFGAPVRFMNDAAMQALGNYVEGRMLFFGLGTSTGACLVADDMLIGIEPGRLRFTRQVRFMDRLSKKGRQRAGHRRWLKSVNDAVELLQDVFNPDLTIIGGGNGKLVDPMPEGCRRVENASAYRGAERMWEEADIFAKAHETTWHLVRRPAEMLALPAPSEDCSDVAHDQAN